MSCRIILGVFLISLLANSELAAQSGEMDYRVPVLTEAFHTDRDQGENVDSPAVWHGPSGEHWLLATAKEGHSILVFDAADGSFLKRVGSEGASEGEFQRPNGIAVIDDLMLVVERDNARVQIFTLPGLNFAGFIAHEDLRYPYGLTVDKNSHGGYELYVSDNYNPALEGYPPEEELDERIHHYRFWLNDDQMVQFETVRLFGEIHGPGILHKVESIFMDRHYNRLLVADEAYSERTIKIYDLEGNFTGEMIPNDYFTSEPEGITLYSCSDGSGYWIMTDQHQSPDNIFQVFDRESLEYMGGFSGEITRNTDGIWLTQRSFGPFDKGAFYPVHDDGSITAIGWSDIARALNLDRDCTAN
ncbi:MAG: phytase [Bacteroidetes bacterium]|nr:phytase [Bacteroidota bacterium]